MREEVFGPKIENLVNNGLTRNCKLNPLTTEDVSILLISKLSINNNISIKAPVSYQVRIKVNGC